MAAFMLIAVIRTDSIIYTDRLDTNRSYEFFML